MAEGDGTMYQTFKDVLVFDGNNFNFEWQMGDLNVTLITVDPTHCEYCGSPWHPNRYHPGSCDTCGGPKEV